MMLCIRERCHGDDQEDEVEPERRTGEGSPLRRIGTTRGDALVATSDRSGTVELTGLELAPLEGIALRLG